MIDDTIQRFIDHIIVERGISKNTLGAYSRDLSQFAAFCEKKKLGDVSEFDEDFLLSYVTHVDKQQYAQSTRIRKICVLRNFVKFLCFKKLISII